VYSQVNVPNGSSTQVLPSPLNDPSQLTQLLPTLLDKCTTTQNTDLTPRVNVNTASQTVLQALQAVTGLADSDVQAIQSNQPDYGGSGAPDPIYSTPTWLLTKANLPIQTVKNLDRYITARTQVYRFQAIGYYEQGGPVSRIEAVVDTNQARPRILYYRDLNELGRAFDIRQIRGQ
jgi:hypothetical protein